MATKVFMEALSPTMEEGRLIKWLKNEGDPVKSGETLAEVETDKAVMELVARGEGVLRKRLVADGETTPVGTLIGVIARADENIESVTGGAAAATGAAVRPAAGGAGAISEGAPGASPGLKGTALVLDVPNLPVPDAALLPLSSAERPRSSPLARRLATERGLSLGAIAGSGPGGRIIKRDVDAVATSGISTALLPAPPRTARPTEEFRDIALTQIRKTIARRLSESIGPVPTFYLTAEFDVERVADMRSAMAELGEAFKVSFNDILIKAVATALAQHPECNAHWLGDRIRHWNSVHLGMAVAIDEGLITPVIFNAEQKRLSEIAAETRDLAKRARERKLKPEEYTGSTFSISNLGMFGIDHFTAIINPPEAGILAIGAIEARPVGVDGQVVLRRRLRVTMSCDHRVIDGATGAKFLQTLRRLVENPLLLVH